MSIYQCSITATLGEGGSTCWRIVDVWYRNEHFGQALKPLAVSVDLPNGMASMRSASMVHWYRGSLQGTPSHLPSCSHGPDI